MDSKKEMQQHGILLVDEMSTRKSVRVKAQNLTYTGLIDFGKDGVQSTNIQDQADHALVLMFQPLADSYKQPIAVFASKGPVKGETLAQLLIKAIILIEKSGGKVHGVVGDGASTNRKFWTIMGVSGAQQHFKNFFPHPFEEDRKIFAFSDTPHLIKTVRNRLYNQKTLQVTIVIILIRFMLYIVLPMLFHIKDSSRKSKNLVGTFKNFIPCGS